MSPGIVVHICAPCLAEGAGTGAQDMARALGDAGIPAQVDMGPCLGACDRPAVLSLQGRGAAYVFAGVRLPGDLDDIVATCRVYAAAPGGWIEDARPCGRLRFCLRTRVPGDG